MSKVTRNVTLMKKFHFIIHVKSRGLETEMQTGDIVSPKEALRAQNQA